MKARPRSAAETKGDLARLGIHVDPEAVMISTPLDKYEADVYELAEDLGRETGLEYSKKKNRVIFPKDARLLQLLGIEESLLEGGL